MSNELFETRHEEFLGLVQRRIQILEEKRSHTVSNEYDDLINFLDLLITEAEYIDGSEITEEMIWYSLALLTLQCIQEYETSPETFGIKALAIVGLLADLPKTEEYIPTLVEPASLADRMKTYRGEVLDPYLDEDGNFLPGSDLTDMQKSLDEILVFVENLDEQTNTLLVSTVLQTIWKMLHIVEPTYEDDAYAVDEHTPLLDEELFPGDSYEERKRYSNFIFSQIWQFLKQLLNRENKEQIISAETTADTDTRTDMSDVNTALVIGNLLSFLRSNQKLKA